MRKLTPEERAAKKAQASAVVVEEVHIHDENCGHESEAKPKRGRKKAEEAPVAEEAPAEEAPAEEAPAEEAPAEEAPVAEAPTGEPTE
jgi:hypothetical protein